MLSDSRSRRYPTATVMIWAVSLLTLAAAAAITTLFVMMPVSLDVGEMISAGAEPWQDALVAAASFTALLIVTALSLRLWHTVRFKPLALMFTAAEIASVGWTGFVVYRDYF